MKRIVKLGTTLVIILISLGGCVEGKPEHGNYSEDSRYKYDNDRPYYDTHMHYFYEGSGGTSDSQEE